MENAFVWKIFPKLSGLLSVNWFKLIVCSGINRPAVLYLIGAIGAGNLAVYDIAPVFDGIRELFDWLAAVGDRAINSVPYLDVRGGGGGGGCLFVYSAIPVHYNGWFQI